MTTANEVGAALRAPFPFAALGWKPQATKGNRALAVAYIDARDVMDRLDEAVGTENWQDAYEFLPGGQVMCRLSVRIGGEWVTKADVGGESEQPDKGDREKAAVSDALKRAAVKFGIGRYLYSMPSQWCDYDPVKKQFTQTPNVPAQFLPVGPRPQQQQRTLPAAKPEPQPPASPAETKAEPTHAEIEDARKRLFATRTADAMKVLWLSFPKAVQARLAADKDKHKSDLAKLVAEGPELDECASPIFAPDLGQSQPAAKRGAVSGMDAIKR